MSDNKKKKADDEETKKLAEEIEDALTDSEEDEHDDTCGYIEVKKAKGDWKHFYAIISGGSMFLYKDSRVMTIHFLLFV